MGVIAEGILRGCQGLFTPVSLGYPPSVFNKNSTLNTLLELPANPDIFQDPMTRSEEATARRAEKRQRSVDEQKQANLERQAAGKTAEVAGGDEGLAGVDDSEWDATFALVVEYKEQQGKSWYCFGKLTTRLQQP